MGFTQSSPRAGGTLRAQMIKRAGGKRNTPSTAAPPGATRKAATKT